MTTQRTFPSPDNAVVLRPLEAPGERLNWGIVSTGNIAHTVAHDLALLPDARILAVASRSEENARKFAREFNIERAYWDGGGQGSNSTTAVAQLCADPDIDVAYVGTPHGQHFEIVSELLRAKKNVLVEKAIALNYRQAQELVQLAKENGVFLMEALWSRFVPGTVRAWELIAGGEIGVPTWLQANMGFHAPYDLSSRIWKAEDGGGALLDLTIYPLNWALAVFGVPEDIAVQGQLAPNGVDAQNTLTLSYRYPRQAAEVGAVQGLEQEAAQGTVQAADELSPESAVAQLHSTFLADTPARVVVGGSQGWLTTSEGPLHNPSAITYQRGREEPVTERFDLIGHGYVYELREVSRCIQHGLSSSPVMDWEASLGIMRIFDDVRAKLGVQYPGE